MVDSDNKVDLIVNVVVKEEIEADDHISRQSSRPPTSDCLSWKLIPVIPQKNPHT